MKILGLIPARGSSKGIPGKNIKLLGGKPLIQYTIEAGLKSQAIDRLIVSTDSPEIAKVAKACGSEVPFLRPGDLAADKSPTLGVIIHALEFFMKTGVEFDAVCLLQPTSPFRSPEDIENAIRTFIKNETDSLISVIPVPHQYNPHWVFEPAENGKLQIATGEKEIITRRQELPPAYIRNGSIYLTKTEVILNKKSLYGDSISYYEMSTEKHVNLDTLKDWEEAVSLISA
jgi:CMP-N,N'-diacetyllegionaminic acid synthase